MPSNLNKIGAPRDDILRSYHAPEDISIKHKLLEKSTKRKAGRAIKAGIGEHLGYEHRVWKPRSANNTRNHKSNKSFRTSAEQFQIGAPCDCDASFKAQLVRTGPPGIERFDGELLARYPGALSKRKSQASYEKLYRFYVSPAMIWNVTGTAGKPTQSSQWRPAASVSELVVRCKIPKLA